MKMTLPFRKFPVAWCFGLFLFLCPARAAEAPADSWHIAPPPAWVEYRPLDAPKSPPPNQQDGGIYDLNFERQINAETQEQYRRSSFVILNEQGVQSEATINIAFDPDYQQLTVHEISVLRDGKVINKLDRSKVRLMNRETNLESHLLDGSLTFYYPMEDVRVGDVVDYSYTIRGFHPLFEGRLFTNATTGWSSPLARQLFRIVGRKDRPLTSKSIAGPDELTRRNLPDGLSEWRLEKTDLPAILAESNVPAWHASYPVVRVSEMADWGEVARWAAPLYQLDGPLSAAEQEAVEEITKNYSTEEARIQAALLFVQRQIRYLGIEMGQGSYRPNSGETVLARRFGDCKDKAQLLARLLRAMKINATPALVNSAWQKGVEDFPPSPIAFDHVICQVQSGGKTFWLDPTLPPQTAPLDSLDTGGYGFGLIIALETTGLSVIAPPASGKNETEVRETFVFDGQTNPVRLEVFTRFHGSKAEEERARFQDSSVDKIGQSFRDFYAARYPDIELAEPVKYTDFPGENRFETLEKYRIAQIWTVGEDKRRSASFYPQLVRDAIYRPDSIRRTAPYALGNPRKISQEIELRFGEPWDVTFSDDAVKTGLVNFRHTGHKADDTVFLRYEYENLADHVPPEEMEGYRKTVDKIIKGLGWSFTSAAEAPTAAKWQPNPVMIFVWLASLTVAAGMVIALVLYRKIPPPLPDPALAHLQGLGGWLIVVQFGIWVRIIGHIGILGSLAAQLNLSTWNAVTSPVSAHYHPAWAGTLIFETAASLIMLIIQLAALVFLYQRRWIFPRLVIGIFIALLALDALDTYLCSQIPGVDANPRTVIQFLFACAIWIPYLLVSKRVRATFIRP